MNNATEIYILQKTWMDRDGNIFKPGSYGCRIEGKIYLFPNEDDPAAPVAPITQDFAHDPDWFKKTIIHKGRQEMFEALVQCEGLLVDRFYETKTDFTLPTGEMIPKGTRLHKVKDKYRANILQFAEFEGINADEVERNSEVFVFKEEPFDLTLLGNLLDERFLSVGFSYMVERFKGPQWAADRMGTYIEDFRHPHLHKIKAWHLVNIYAYLVNQEYKKQRDEEYVYVVTLTKEVIKDKDTVGLYFTWKRKKKDRLYEMEIGFCCKEAVERAIDDIPHMLQYIV